MNNRVFGPETINNISNLRWNIIHADVLDGLGSLADQSVQCVVTSPPYWGLRDYGIESQIGKEPTPEEYVERLVVVFREVWRVLRDDGVVWLNLGDSYNGYPGNVTRGGALSGRNQHARQHKPSGYGLAATNLKPKDLVGIPWRVAFALQADGWWLRSDIIWAKPNPMPESVTDRPTKAHEYIFLLSKNKKYYYNHKAIKEPAVTKGQKYRNKRDVWTVTTKPYPEAHFAVYPEELIEPCVLAGSAKDNIVLDPFCGSGTTGVVALRHGRKFIGIELNGEYVKLAEKRIKNSLVEQTEESK